MRTYNADNKPVEIAYTKGSTTNVSFRYDGQGNRVIKSSGQGTTYYVGEYYEIINDAGVKYIFAGDMRIAKIDSSKASPDRTLYYHKDHLGSSSAITNENSAVVETFTYRPFGDQRAHSGDLTTDDKYTDQEFDSETGLYDYGARYYDPAIGRFISPDSVVPHPFDPQSLNRFSYGENNPLICTDPDGHCPVCIAMAVGAVIGGVSAGIRFEWKLDAVVQGAFICAFSSAASFAAGKVVGSLLSDTTAVGASETTEQAIMSKYPILASAGDDWQSIYCPSCHFGPPPVAESGGFASVGRGASGGMAVGSFSVSIGYGGTIVAGWGDKTLGFSGGFSLNYDVVNGSFSFQSQITKWDNVYGAYYGVGEQYGLNVNQSPSIEGFSTTGEQYTAGGGAGWRAGGDVSAIGSSTPDSTSLQGGFSGRSGNAFGAFGGAGRTMSAQYNIKNVWKAIIGN